MAITTQILLTTSKAAPYSLTRHLRPKEDSREVLFSRSVSLIFNLPEAQNELVSTCFGVPKTIPVFWFHVTIRKPKKTCWKSSFFRLRNTADKTGISPKLDRFSVSSDLLGFVFGRTWATFKGRASFCRDWSKLLHQFCPILTTDVTYKWFKSYDWPSILMTFILYLA